MTGHQSGLPVQDLTESELYYTTNDDGVHVRCTVIGCGWAYNEGFMASVADVVDSVTRHRRKAHSDD